MSQKATAPREQSQAEIDAIGLLDQVIAEHQDAARRYLPIMNPKLAEARKIAMRQLKELVLKEGEDFGKPPGTDRADARDVLLKPGAEKICAYFGYVPSYEVLAGSVEDWTGADHKGEPLFYYHISCVLMKDGVPVGGGSGSCNSWESKYRYRSANRECPSCGRNDALIRGKAEYEKNEEYKKRGSWICFEKKGGCGAKYFGDDPEIMSQQVGSIANDKIFDLVNTVRKMADKRAYIAAVLSATGASQFFTQDLDDMPEGIVQGTRDDQKRIQDAKIAEGRRQEEQRKANGGGATASAKQTASKPAPEQQNAPPAATSQTEAGPARPRTTGAKVDDPEELKQTMFAYTGGDATKRRAIAQQLLDMLSSKDAAAEGEEVMKQFDCAFPTDLVDLTQQQACVRALWLAVARVWEQ